MGEYTKISESSIQPDIRSLRTVSNWYQDKLRRGIFPCCTVWKQEVKDKTYLNNCVICQLFIYFSYICFILIEPSVHWVCTISLISDVSLSRTVMWMLKHQRLLVSPTKKKSKNIGADNGNWTSTFGNHSVMNMRET